MKELEAKGFSAEIIKKLNTMEVNSRQGLILRIRTAEKYNHLKKEVSSLEKAKLKTQEEFGLVVEKKKRAEAELVSEQNSLDDLRLKSSTYKGAVDIASSFLADGYSAEDLQGLKCGIDMLGIKNDRRLSLTRLLEGLEKQRSLTSLEEVTNAKRAQLASVYRELNDKKSELEVLENLTLKAVEETRCASIKSISEMAEHTRAILDSAPPASIPVRCIEFRCSSNWQHMD
jgi:hypothetical protein